MGKTKRAREIAGGAGVAIPRSPILPKNYEKDSHYCFALGAPAEAGFRIRRLARNGGFPGLPKTDK